MHFEIFYLYIENFGFWAEFENLYSLDREISNVQV